MRHKVADANIWVWRNIELTISLPIFFIWWSSVPIILLHWLSSSLTGIWWYTLLESSTIHSWKFIPLIEIFWHPSIFRVMPEISRMIGGITVKVCTLSYLRLQYSVEENSVFRLLDVWADWNMRILLLLLQLLSVRQININSGDLFLLSSIIMQEISSLNRSSSHSLVMVSLAFVVLRLINFVDILNQWLIHCIWNVFWVF